VNALYRQDMSVDEEVPFGFMQYYHAVCICLQLATTSQLATSFLTLTLTSHEGPVHDMDSRCGRRGLDDRMQAWFGRLYVSRAQSPHLSPTANTRTFSSEATKNTLCTIYHWNQDHSHRFRDGNHAKWWLLPCQNQHFKLGLQYDVHDVTVSRLPNSESFF
jgi:hypothetical protein